MLRLREKPGSASSKSGSNIPWKIDKEGPMSRLETLDQVKQEFGLVPDWFKEMPEAALEQHWATLRWVLSDSELSAREKALVAFGAAAAIHCAY
jgi:alkylhydroperoxidase/carboxymuconolactone decarboxylase family protein YurZ